jgi:hypothetical protein
MNTFIFLFMEHEFECVIIINYYFFFKKKKKNQIISLLHLYFAT